MKPKMSCCTGAYPNFERVSEETRKLLDPKQLAELEQIEALRDAFATAIKRAGIQWPEACADFVIIALGTARSSLAGNNMNDSIQAHERASRELTNALTMYRLETAVESGVLTKEAFKAVCDQINDFHEKVHVAAATPKES